MPETTRALTIASDLNEIAGVSDAIESLMQEQGFAGENILDTQLAVEEVVTNIIVHGYQEKGGQIDVALAAGPEAIVIRLEDRAPAFNPLLLPEPDINADIEDRKIGGLGIFLTRQIMDDIEYRFEENKNILILTKRKSG